MQMRRFLTTGLAFIVTISCWGHVLAATFCSAGLGRNCCLAMRHSSMMHDHEGANCMAMHGMSIDSTTIDGSAMGMSDQPSNESFTIAAPESEAISNVKDNDSFDQSPESCPHCLTHSGPASLPMSALDSPNNRNAVAFSFPVVGNSIFCSSSHFSGTDLPRGHAPPGNNSSRHVLISVFLI